ncbi:hypothetical protein F53441_14139 [Fusarium austroafricanum]|uniref:Uncharacterized protein n=1 Tax=Fusarium austroafricanum TaxID=2364996 RepID=A0A8H4JH19_9HYPO|nr:hypothetical protein F53441_14139 [Fusarium austroafricanum]
METNPTHGVDLSASGTCTVLALRASRDLEKKHPGVFDFRMYDVGGHKISRCLKTHIIIHSSSREGEVKVPPGKVWKYQQRSFKWRANGSGSYTTEGKANPIEFQSLPVPEALASSLYEVATNTKLITLFRFSGRGNRWTKGFMKWYLTDDSPRPGPSGEKFLVLSEKKGDKEPTRIVWREGLPEHEREPGTRATEDECVKELNGFVDLCGSFQQWRIDGCKDVHDKLWLDLTKAYGHPVLKRG